MIHLVSHTSLYSPGGVPRWNRDFITGLGGKHWCYEDYVNSLPCIDNRWRPEYERARDLSSWLIATGRVDLEKDIVIADGFWADGFNPKRTVSVCHGNYGHLIKEEADAGKQPDFPDLHAAQVLFRKRFLDSGGRLVAVSQFIQHQMLAQWGYESTVVNNGIDTKRFLPEGIKHPFRFPFIVHGINDRQNTNKGWDHISAVIEKTKGKAIVFSLDQAHHILGGDKYDVLSMADFAIIPSAHEGNSYFLLECLALGVPVVAYDVGLVWELSPWNPAGRKDFSALDVGMILNRKMRSVEYFVETVEWYLHFGEWSYACPSLVAKEYDIEHFWGKWRRFLWKHFKWTSADS